MFDPLLVFLCFPCPVFQSHMFPLLSSFPARAYFQMARNKRKATATVPRRQDHLHAPVSNPDDHDGSVVLALKVVHGSQSSVVLHESNSDPRPIPSSSTSGANPNNPHLDHEMTFVSGSKFIEEVLVEDCSDEKDLEEEKLDFTFSEEECEGSPKYPSLLSTKHVSPPCIDGQNLDITTTTGKSLSPPPSSSKWRDLFSSNRNI